MLSTCLGHCQHEAHSRDHLQEGGAAVAMTVTGWVTRKARLGWLTLASEASVLLIQLVLPASVVILLCDICLYISC